MRTRFIRRMETEILGQTNLTESVFREAASHYSEMPQLYHNYFHAVTFTHAVVEIGRAAGFSRGKLSLFALAGLYHDSGNEDAPLMTPIDELRAAFNFYNDWHDREDELRRMVEAGEHFDVTQIVKIGMGLILATPMHVRRQIATNSDHALFADADFHFCAVTPCYWMYTSQGMRLEWSRTKNDGSALDPVNFWRSSSFNFILSFLMPSGQYGPFRSAAAQSVYPSDPRWILGVVASLPERAYHRAMELHDEDVELVEFFGEMMEISGMPEEFGMTQQRSERKH